MQKIKIIHFACKEEPYYIVFKPEGIPSAPLSKNDSNNVLNYVSEKFNEVLFIKGKKEIEGGLLHRLDTATSGLIMIASTQDFYDYMINEQNNNRFLKKYSAQCVFFPNNTNIIEGFPVKNFNELYLNKKGEIKSLFRSYGKGSKSVRPVLENASKIILKKTSNKLYKTNIIINSDDSLTKVGSIFNVECSISQGFRHQVRAHLAWSGLPIIGDKLYNGYNSFNEKLEFCATGLEFFNPITNKKDFFYL